MPIIPKILVLAGSVRAGAYSGKTADVAQKELAVQGAEVTRISLADYPLPIIGEGDDAIPENATMLARQIAAHDGILLVTPEYNASLPPLLKNAIDWVSRVRLHAGQPSSPLAGRAAALCSASTGPCGGIRAIGHLRAVLVHCRVEVVSPECSIGLAAQAFDEAGELKDAKLSRAMQTVAQTLIERARMLSERIEP
ncbi:MAG TPA: NADPH-dependent FMN reductase [Mesorhizobium sp.]